MNARHVTAMHVSVERMLLDAISGPGLAHIRTNVDLCDGDDKLSARIDFTISGKPCGIAVLICSDGAFVLVDRRGEHDIMTDYWESSEVNPPVVCAAVVDALRKRVTEPARS